MLSRVLPILNTILPTLGRTSAFMFATQDFRADRAHQRQVLRLENCNSLKDVMRYVGANGNKLQEKETKEGIKMMMRFKPGANAWQSMAGFSRSLEALDPNKSDVDTLGYICGLAPLFAQNYALNYTFYVKVCQRVKQLLQQQEDISNENILNFLDCAYEMEKRQLVENLHQVLQTRIANLRYKEYGKFLEVFSKRRIPTKKEKQNFNAFINKLNIDAQKLETRTLLTCYRHLKTMNNKIWDCEAISSKLFEIINNKIDEFDEKQILHALNFRGSLNPFQKNIFKKLLDSFEDGKSLIGTETFFKLLRRIELGDKTKIVGQSETKLMAFIEQNLGQVKDIINLLQKDILTRQSLVKLATKISESEHRKRYEQNYNYVYEMVSRGIIKADQHKDFISMIKAEEKKPSFSSKFMATALITERLHGKNSNDQQLKQLHEEFKKLVSEVSKSPKLFSTSFFNNSLKMFQNFNKRYGQYLLENFVKEYSEPDKKINNSVLNFLLISNNRDLFKILKKNKNVVTIQQTTTILKKMCANPTDFVGRHEFIASLLIMQINPEIKFNEMRAIVNYLCNTEVHASLDAEEANAFIRLAQACVKNYSFNSFYLRNLVIYLTHSPSNFVKMSSELPKFIEDVQQKIFNLEPAENLSKNFGVLAELIKFNLLSKKVADKFLKQNEGKPDGFFSKYAKVVLGNKPTIGEEIDEDSLLTIVRSRELRDEDIESHLGKINQLITKLKPNEVESALVNFEMIKSQKTSNILNSLIKKYTETVKQRAKSKLYTILSNLQKQNYNSANYRELLKLLCENFSKNQESVSLSLHTLVLSECVNKSIECADYAKKLTYFLENKYHNGQLRFQDAFELVENLMVVDFELAFKMFSHFRYHYLDQEKKRPYDLFILANLSDEKVQGQLVKLFKSLKNVQINQGMYHYLTASIPELKNVEMKTKIENYKQSWLNQSLINFFKTNNINHTIVEKHGEKMIKIDDKYIATSGLLYNEANKTKLQQFYGTIFDIAPQERKNIVTLFLSRRNDKRNFANIISSEIPALKDHKNGILNAFKDSQKQNRDAQRERREANNAARAAKKQERAQNMEAKNEKKTSQENQVPNEAEKQSKKTQKSEWQS